MLAYISTEGCPDGLFYIWLYANPYTANEKRYIRAYFDFNERKHAAKFLRDYKVTAVEFSGKMSPRDRQFLGWFEHVVKEVYNNAARKAGGAASRATRMPALLRG